MTVSAPSDNWSGIDPYTGEPVPNTGLNINSNPIRPTMMSPGANDNVPNLAPAANDNVAGEGVLSRFGRMAGRLGAGTLGAGVAIAPAVQGPNALKSGTTDEQMKAAKTSDDDDRNQFWDFWHRWAGGQQPSTDPSADPNAVTAPNPGAAPAPYPVTESGSPTPMDIQGRAAFVPPGAAPAGGGPAVPYPPPRPAGGGGGRGGGRAPPMMNLRPQAAAPITPNPGWGMIDRPNMSPQNGGGQMPSGRGNGGDPKMGAFDFSTLFDHPGVAAAAAQHPMVHAAAANHPAVRARVHGPLAKGALGPAPTAGYPVTGSGSPTPMDIQDRTRGRALTPADYGDQTWLRGTQPLM